MTILTGPSLLKKPFLNSQNVNVENGDDQKVVFMEAGTPADGVAPPRGSAAVVFCMAIIALLVASVGCLCGLELYREYMKTNNNYRRYQGFCSIPIERDYDQVEPQFRMMPLHWSNSEANMVSFDPDEKVSPQDDDIRSIREELDIGDMVEEISVTNSDGRQTSFIHDFSANLSGIIDEERCFLMDLDPELVMAPRTFVMTIEGNGKFDVTRVQAAMRAVIPALRLVTSAHIRDRCGARPVYRLRQDDREHHDERDEHDVYDKHGDRDVYKHDAHGSLDAIGADRILVRKRSVESAPTADFTHFAGHRVQEIIVTNLPALRDLENNHHE